MSIGWGTFFGGIGKLLGKIPLQSRVERWKNELDSLEKEKENLKRGVCDEKKSARLIVIDERIEHFQRLLKNSSNSD